MALPPLTTARRALRAVALAPGGGFRLAELPRPVPGPGEILLALRCCGLCGTDLWKLAYGGPPALPAGTVLGHEVVGTVVEVGPGVSGFRAGDRVAAPHHVACGECEACRRGNEPLCPAFRANQLSPGGFSDLVRVGERAVRRAVCGLPDSLPDAAAVFLEPGACVLRGLYRSGLRELAAAGRGGPASAAVLGAGSMGLLHLLLLKALWPALPVVLVDPLPERRERALALGADAAAPPGEEARRAVEGLAGGGGAWGADAVFDTAGGAAALGAALDLTRPGGTTVLFAHAAPEGRSHLGEIDLNRFFKAERRLIGTYSGSLAEQRDVFRLLVTGRLDPAPLVTHRLPLSRFAEAVELARDRRALKVLLTPDGDPGGAG